METGECHLCGKLEQLEESHVWPSFAYKRFAADLGKGGRFIDLHRMALTNKQYKRYWFCGVCEDRLQRAEDWVARMCTRIENDPTVPQAYNVRLHEFAVSISWRALKLISEDMASNGSPNMAVESKWPAARQWRRYLSGKANSIRPYSQHLFILADTGMGLEKGLGGEVFEREGMILSQVGFLFMVGHLNPKVLQPAELVIWRKSQVKPGGGEVTPIQRWVFGRGKPSDSNITNKCAALLKVHEMRQVGRILSEEWKPGRRSDGN